VKLKVLVPIVASALLLAGCGASSTSGSTPATGNTDLAAYTAKVEQGYRGSFTSPPTTAPTPPHDLNVWAISCGEQITYCALSAAAAKEAGEALGWKVTIFDSKGDAVAAGDGVRQAVAAHPDAIIAWTLDCAVGRLPLDEAKKAGIKLIGVESIDCKNKVYDGAVTYAEGDFPAWIRAYGALQADWIIDKIKGHGKTIAFAPTGWDAAKIQTEGFRKEMATCAACKVVSVDMTTADIGTQLQGKAQSALLQNPDATAVWALIDAIITGGVGPALQASGGASKYVMGAEGLNPAPDLARAGVQQDAGVGFAPGWEGYAAIDALIRVLAHQPVLKSGIGLQLWDKDHNLPAQGQSYQPPFDYKSIYLKSWGVDG